MRDAGHEATSPGDGKAANPLNSLDDATLGSLRKLGNWAAGPENEYAILQGHAVVPASDFAAWSEWMAEHKYTPRERRPDGWTTPSEDETRVGRTEVGDHVVSTVFLGLNHGFGDQPLWFETMVFGRARVSNANPKPEGYEEYCQRYETWEEAEAGHAAVVARLARTGEE